jgi:hypothetical protein
MSADKIESNPPRAGHRYQTYTGVMFWPIDPRPEEVRIDDIAHHLSLLCRYNGACAVMYSVAQHSVLVSRIVPLEHALWGLMHDAAEAYVGDMVRPLKKMLPAYAEIEERVMRAIAKRFELPWPEPPEIKIADDRVLMTEQRDLMGPSPAPWRDSGEPLEERISPWPSAQAEAEFLAWFRALGGK